MTNKYDVAVIGGGIVGLATAYAANQKGYSVILFERHQKPLGATIRNFGMVWPIGQGPSTLGRALKSREIWLTLAKKAKFWAETKGSLHLAYHEDELNVLEEFVNTTTHLPYRCELLTPVETTEKSNAFNPVGLEGAMFSATEVNVDPREATLKLHHYFKKQLGITIEYNTAISQISYPYLYSGDQKFAAERIFVCSGADFETLYPETFKNSKLTKCKLQMLQTVPQPMGWKLGPNLAAGLTLQHYASFDHCESLASLKDRISRELPEYNKWGIHVMMSQAYSGALTIGDSHEYGWALEPFDKEEINILIMKYLSRFVKVPSLRIAQHWNGVYAKLPGKTEFIAHPEDHVTIVNGLSGAGMTLSFGLAEELVD